MSTANTTATRGMITASIACAFALVAVVMPAGVTSQHTREIAKGVFYPVVQLGACKPFLFVL